MGETQRLCLPPEGAPACALPNAALALEYLRALPGSITPVPVAREGAGYHDDALAPLASATAVRAEKKLDLVVTLKGMRETEGELDRTGEDRQTRTILGVEVPQITIPVSAGRDLVNLVETAAQQYKLLAAGHDAVKALDAQLCARAEGKV